MYATKNELQEKVFLDQMLKELERHAATDGMAAEALRSIGYGFTNDLPTRKRELKALLSHLGEGVEAQRFLRGLVQAGVQSRDQFGAQDPMLIAAARRLGLLV